MCNMLMSSAFMFGDRNFSGNKFREASALRLIVVSELFAT